MRKTMQAPALRKNLIQWIEDVYSIAIDVRQSDGGILRIEHDDNILPEINVLFFGNAESFRDTVEIGGMYDRRTHSFHFMRSQLASVVDGLSEAEIYTGGETSESVYNEMRKYAEKAVEEQGYQYKCPAGADYVAFRRNIQSALSSMVKYAELLTSRGEHSAVQGIRELAEEMLYFWCDPVYLIYEKGLKAVEQQYMEQFDRAVAESSVHAPANAFSSEDAKAIFRGLVLHAVETEDNEDALSVWKCCCLAKRLGEDYPEEKELFRGDFTPNYDDQFDGSLSKFCERCHAAELVMPQTVDQSEQDTQTGGMTLA